MIEISNLMVRDKSSPLIFQITTLLKKVSGRNNHNAPKLIEKYNDLAREALSNGDKILSEIIYNMLITSRVFLMRKRILEEKNIQ